MNRFGPALLALLLAAPAAAQTVPFGSLTPGNPGVVQTNDKRATAVTLSSALNSFIDIPLNGQNVVGLKFVGLTASGATITYYSSNDATQTPASSISSLNAALGQLSGTRTTDGETRVPVSGRTTLRLQVTTAGTGTITVSYNVSAAGLIFDLGSPIPPGANSIGLIGNTSFGISGTLPAFAATPTFNLGTAPTLTVQGTLSTFTYANASAAAPGYAAGQQFLSQDLSGNLRTLDANVAATVSAAGTSASKAQGIQGIAGGVAVAVSAASLPLPAGAATSANQPTSVAPGATTSGQTGTLGFGAASTTAPALTTAQSYPLSLTLAGALRVDSSAVTQPISAAALPLPTGAATSALQTSTQGSATGGTAATVATLVGGLYNSTAPTLTNGQQAAAQLSANGSTFVDLSRTASSGTQLGGTIALGAYSTTLPSYSSGFNSPAVIDSHGHLRTAEEGSDNPLVGIVANGGAGSTCSAAATTTGCVAKNAAGNLYRAYATATSAPAAQQYLVCVNATAVPTSTSAITAVDWAPFNLATTAGSTASINFGPGPPSGYTTGIVCLVSTSLTTYTLGTASFVNTSVR